MPKPYVNSRDEIMRELYDTHAVEAYLADNLASTKAERDEALAEVERLTGPEARERLARHLFMKGGGDGVTWDQRELAIQQVRGGPNGEWLARGMTENFGRIYARADELLAVIAGKKD